MKKLTQSNKPTEKDFRLFVTLLFVFTLLFTATSAEATGERMYVVIDDTSGNAIDFSFREDLFRQEVLTERLLLVPGVEYVLCKKHIITTYDNKAFFRKEIEDIVISEFTQHFGVESIKIFYLKDFKSREELENAITDFLRNN